MIKGNSNPRILNFDPTSEIIVIKDDVDPDLVAPIISFTRPDAVSSDKVLSTNIKNVQNLFDLKNLGKRIFSIFEKT